MVHGVVAAEFERHSHRAHAMESEGGKMKRWWSAGVLARSNLQEKDACSNEERAFTRNALGEFERCCGRGRPRSRLNHLLVGLALVSTWSATSIAATNPTVRVATAQAAGRVVDFRLTNS